MEEILWHCEHEDEQGVTDFEIRVKAVTEGGAGSRATSIARSSIDLGVQVEPDKGEWRCCKVHEDHRIIG
jgi:hypothetical protein